MPCRLAWHCGLDRSLVRPALVHTDAREDEMMIFLQTDRLADARDKETRRPGDRQKTRRQAEQKAEQKAEQTCRACRALFTFAMYRRGTTATGAGALLGN